MTKISSKILKRLEEFTGLNSESLFDSPIIISSNYKQSFHTDVVNIVLFLKEFFNKRHQYLLDSEIKVLSAISNIEKISGLEKSNVFGRPDGFLTSSGFKIIELNLGPSIGGLLAISSLQSFWRKEFKESLDFLNLFDELAFFLKYLAKEEKIFAYRIQENRFANYEAQNVKIEKEMRDRGVDYNFSYLSDLKIKLQNEKITGYFLRRHEPEIGDLSDREIREFEEKSNEYGITNIFYPRKIFDILDSKILLSFFSEYENPSNVVWSRWLGNSTTNSDQKFIQRTKILIENKNNFVLKRDASFFGKHIIFGDEIDSNEEWVILVKNCIKDGNWIFQEIQSGIDLRDVNNKIPLKGVVSPFIFGEKLGGIAVRLRLDEKRKNLVMPHNSKTLITIAGFNND